MISREWLSSGGSNTATAMADPALYSANSGPYPRIPFSVDHGSRDVLSETTFPMMAFPVTIFPMTSFPVMAFSVMSSPPRRLSPCDIIPRGPSRGSASPTARRWRHLLITSYISELESVLYTYSKIFLMTF